MPTLREVLADRNQYQDALAWNLGNGVTVTLGQLRGLDAETQAAITKADQKATEAAAAAATKLEEAKRSNLQAANLYTVLMQAQEAIKAGRYDDPAVKQVFGNATPTPIGTPTNDPFAALSRLEQDTLFGPVVGVIKLVRDEAKKAREEAAALQEINKKMATNYMNGVLEDRYDRVVPKDKQSDSKLSMEALITHAVRNNQFSTDTTPNIRWAYRDLTSGEVSAANEAAVAERATVNVLKTIGYTDEQIASMKDKDGKLIIKPAAPGTEGTPSGIFVSPPQTFGLDVHNRTGAAPKPFKNLDEAFAAAEKDTDIWKQVDQLTH